MTVYRIKSWNSLYENNRTRELAHLDFVLVPNKHDGFGFRTIIGQPDGLQLFGAWVLVLQVASKCKPRGTLIRDSCQPHTAESIAVMTGADPATVGRILEFASSEDVGWIEKINIEDFPELVFDVAPEVKSRAQGRLAHALSKKSGEVLTPAGFLNDRPLKCQWCDNEAGPVGRGHAGIVAHHLLGYGDPVRDLTVIFVCRPCHGNFEYGRFSTADVFERFGTKWLDKSRMMAREFRTGVGNYRVEGKGMEGNGKKEGGAAIAASAVVEEWNKSGLPKCIELSTKRRSSLSVRLKDPFFLEHWAAAIAKLKTSKFCLGDNDRGWKATFDWFIKPDSCVKIIEGKYDTNSTTHQAGVDRKVGTIMQGRPNPHRATTPAVGSLPGL